MHGDLITDMSDVSAPDAQPPGTLRGSLRVHRPQRSWPHPPAPEVIELTAAPAPPDQPSSRLAALLPALGSLAMIGFAFLVHSLVYLIVIGSMVVVMVGAGLLSTTTQRRGTARRWARTRARYAGHLDAVRALAAAAAAAQRDAAQACFPDPDTLPGVAARGDGLWERRPGDEDFGAVRLGRGRVPARRPVRVARDHGPLAEADPDLADAADRLVAATATLAGTPVVIPLGRLGSVAVVGRQEDSRALVAAWVAGLATFHAPAELRIMALVPLSAVRSWSWLKWLPHTRDPEAGEGFGRVNRAVTADGVAFAATVDTLARQRLDRLRRRREAATGLASPGAAAGGAAEQELEHVVIVVDGYHPGDGPAALESLLPLATAVNVTVVLLVDTHADVPAACGARVDWAETGTVRYVESGPQGRVETDVTPDRLSQGPADELARILAPLALRSGEAGADLADPVRLIELLGMDEVADPGVAARWLTAGALAHGVPPEFLSVPIGRTGEGSPLMLDLKEAAMDGMGPHGLLVGATGSGKSELLRSLATGLAVRHDPSVLNLLLVDFKGGAAFAELEGFPHVAGLVTNLADDLSLVDRMRLAIVGELARRQEALRLAGNLGSIAEYQAARARGTPLEPLPYLVVIVDEFGELLAAKPDFLDVFLTVGRLGRSLGMHLLLATQRLDEGRIRALEPHLRYRLCLRTFTAEESRAVLGTADAFELPSLPGLGYLKVDAGQRRFKAAICGTAPSRQPAEEGGASRDGVGSLLRMLSLGGPASAAAQTYAPRLRTSDVQALVHSARHAAEGTARKIWTAPLPASLTLGGLRKTLGGRLDSSEQGIAVGLADFPERQAKKPVRYSPAGAGGNLGVAGAPRTGKSTLLQTLLIALCVTAGPDQRQFYCLDLGGGSLFELASLPHVGAVVGRGEAEGAARLFRELRSLLDERAVVRQARTTGQRGQLRQAGQPGQPEHAWQDGQNGHPAQAWPEVFLVVDNVGQLRQSAPDLEPDLIELATAGLPFGLHVLVTANRWLDIRPQLLDALGTRWELHLADPAESLAGRQAAAQVPADRPGRGLLRSGHSFQAALPALADEPSPGGLAEAIAVIASSATGARAPAITPLPLRVTRAIAADLALAAGSAPASPSPLPAAPSLPPPVSASLLAPTSSFPSASSLSSASSIPPISPPLPASQLPPTSPASPFSLATSSSSVSPWTGDGFLLGVSEFRSQPVELDLARPGARFLVYGDPGSGRTTLLRRVTARLRDASPAGTLVLDIVDPRRGLLDLADHPAVRGYAASAASAEKLVTRLVGDLSPRAVPDDATLEELSGGHWWSGPAHVLVVDDYDLLIGSMGGPFSALADLLAQGPDIGLGVVLARRVAGSQRTSFEAFGQRLREVADHILVLSGQQEEGPLAAGVIARPRPPGRGVLISGHTRPRLIQCLVEEAAQEGSPVGAWRGGQHG